MGACGSKKKFKEISYNTLTSNNSNFKEKFKKNKDIKKEKEFTKIQVKEEE